MTEEKTKKIRCSKCGSTLNYFRTSTGERVCRSCGHIEKIFEGKKKKTGLLNKKQDIKKNKKEGIIFDKIEPTEPIEPTDITTNITYSQLIESVPSEFKKIVENILKDSELEVGDLDINELKKMVEEQTKGQTKGIDKEEEEKKDE